jgi:hypothetical protein
LTVRSGSGFDKSIVTVIDPDTGEVRHKIGQFDHWPMIVISPTSDLLAVEDKLLHVRTGTLIEIPVAVRWLSPDDRRAIGRNPISHTKIELSGLTSQSSRYRFFGIYGFAMSMSELLFLKLQTAESSADRSGSTQRS